MYEPEHEEFQLHGHIQQFEALASFVGHIYIVDSFEYTPLIRSFPPYSTLDALIPPSFIYDGLITIESVLFIRIPMLIITSFDRMNRTG
jgi:hypothetical protein